MKGFCCLIPEVLSPLSMKATQVPSNLPPDTFVTEDLERKHPAKGDSCAVTVLPCLKANSCQAGPVLSGALPSGSAYVLILESQCH